MGAIVGGLYASGYDANEIEQILDAIDWADVLRDKTARGERSMRRKEDDLRLLGGIEVGIRDGKISFPRGLIQGQKLELLLRRLTLPTWGMDSFDQLPIPFRAVATDIVTGEKVVFASGDLAMAIRASMSVPGAFAPVRVDGRLLVDGGVVDNVPIDEARKLGAQRLIVSRVGSPLLPEDRLDSPLAISHQMAGILMGRIVEAQISSLGDDDLLITPALGQMGSQEFNLAAHAVGIGERAAEDALTELRRYGVDEASYAKFKSSHKLPATTPHMIEFVDVDDSATSTADFIRARIGDQLGKTLDIDSVERALATAYGEGRYEQLQWQLSERDGKDGLVVKPEDKRWGPDFLHFALRISDDFDGMSNYQLIGELTKTGITTSGAEARIRLGLGQVEELFGEYYQPMGTTGRHSLSAYAGYRATDRGIDLAPGTTFASFRYSQWHGGVRWAYSPHHDWEGAILIERGRERLRLEVGDASQINGYQAELGSVAIQLRHDSIDSSAFPSDGQRLLLSQERYLQSLGAEQSAFATRIQWDAAWSRGDAHVLAGLRASSSSGGEGLLDAYGFLGGLGNLSGFGEESIFAPQTALVRGVYYHRIAHADSLLTIPLYVGGSAELGGYWLDRRDFGRDLIGAGSIFVGADTFMGPIFIGYGRAQGGRDSFYLTFGSLLRNLDGF